MTENGDRYPSWKWVVGVLVLIVMSAISVVFSVTYGGLKNAQDSMQSEIGKKLDKDQYYREQQQYFDDMKYIKEDLQCIKNWHLPPELRVKQ